MKENICKHNNGCLFKTHCEAGVNYRQLVGGDKFGWVKRTPCNTSHETDIKCDKLELPTPEEVAESEKDFEGFSQMIKLTFSIVSEMKAKYSKTGASEIIECPACKGNLHVSISSYNGHCHGSCETDGCLRWME